MITKSQKRHLKKVEKRKAKKEQRKIKQLKEQEASGKLIEENHNGGYYSVEFTLKAIERFLKDIQCMRLKYQTLLLKWSPDLPRNSEFYFIMEILDYYRENKENSEEGLRNIVTKFYTGA